VRAIRRVLAHLRSYKGDSVGAALAMLLVAAASLTAPQMVRLAIDGGLAAHRWPTVVAAVGGLVLIAAARGAFNFAQAYLAARASEGVAFDLRNALFARIQRLSFSYHDQAQTGELLTRLTSDVEQVQGFVGSGLVQLAAALAMLLGCLVLLFLINPALAGVALSAVLPILWLLGRFIRRAGPLFRDIQAALGQVTVVLEENLHGLEVIRGFGGEARELARYGGVNDRVRDLNLEVIAALANNFPFVTFFVNLGTLAVVGFGGVQILRQHLTLGELLAFNSYLGFLFMPILTLGVLAAQLSRAGASAVRIFELLDAPSEVSDRADARPLSAVRGRVELCDVRFGYAGGGREILRDVSFTVEPGQMVALLGATGAGKSTLINLIPRFYDVTAGAVRIDGQDVRQVTLSSLRAQVGIVLQNALLFSGTVRHNIAYGRPDATLEEIRNAAAAAQAVAFIEALPQGYDTVIGERGVGLSGGQRQRIAIARTLLTDPRLLILDDSTSAVDAATEHAIQAALDALMRDRRRTTLVIAQRVSTVRDADLVLVLEAGRIVAQGRHEELLQSSRLYNEIVGAQLQMDGVVRPAA
jgi:ATP-binding cassette subfamily B protein